MVDWRMLKMRIETCCRLHPLIAKMRITKDYKGLQKDCEDEDCKGLRRIAKMRIAICCRLHLAKATRQENWRSAHGWLGEG